MRYTVTANKVYETVAGDFFEEVECWKVVYTQGQAIKIAEEMYNDNKDYSSIYISYAHRDSACFLNPLVGHEPVGEDWIPHFGAGFTND